MDEVKYEWCATWTIHAAHSLFVFHPGLFPVPLLRQESGSALLFCHRRLSHKILAAEGQYRAGREYLAGRKTGKGRGQSVSAESAADAADCQETAVFDQGLGVEVRIQRMVEYIANPGVLFRDTWLEGGSVLRCFRGRFRFELEGCAPIEIAEGETIVAYPGQRLTIEALDKADLLVYVMLEGDGVAAYFDRLGFFNGIHGPTSAQIELFREVKSRFETHRPADQAELVGWLSDLLVTYAHDLRVGDNAVVGNAIRQIRDNLRKGIVRLTELYDQLQVGHTTLSMSFRRAGVGSPARFIRQEQLRQVKDLLTRTRKPIAAIAAETGFISCTHFANFVKRTTGKTAREIRRDGA
ncbi:MAG: helix-turn-helix domain-containing protein [Kiritimatiellia bacterium]